MKDLDLDISEAKCAWRKSTGADPKCRRLPGARDLGFLKEALVKQRRRTWVTHVSLWGWCRWREWLRSGFVKKGPAFAKPQDAISWPYGGNSQCSLPAVWGVCEQQVREWSESRPGLRAVYGKKFDLRFWILATLWICLPLPSSRRWKVGDRYQSTPQPGWGPSVTAGVQGCKRDNKTGIWKSPHL